MIRDVNGIELGKGDLVAPLSGDMRGRVCDLRTEEGLGFVCVRPSHHPYAKGIWYAADHVQWLQKGKLRRRSRPARTSKKTA